MFHKNKTFPKSRSWKPGIRKSVFTVLAAGLLPLFLIDCGNAVISQAGREDALAQHLRQKQENPRGKVYLSARYQSVPVEEGPEQKIQNGSENTVLAEGCETEGPEYANDTRDFECVFENPQATEMSLYFGKFHTETNYDFVFLYDQNDTLKHVYHGNLGSFWSEPVPGQKLTLRFRSDASAAKSGFRVEKIALGDPGPEPVDEIPVGYNQVPVNYESSHGITKGPKQHWHEERIISQPGAEEIQIHFEKVMIDLLCLVPYKDDGCQVWVRVFDGDGNLVKKWAGSTNERNQWVTVPGDRAVIEFEIDTPLLGGVLNEYGWKVNLINVKTNQPVRKFASKYPVILHHGFAGFDTVLGIDYFFRVKDSLEKSGYEVYVTEVPAFGSLQDRTDALAEQVDAILTKSSERNNTTIDKVHIIGHSMGGLDSRLLISDNTEGYTSSDNPDHQLFGKGYKNKVASLTTVATPHYGTPVADLIMGKVPGNAQKALAFVLDWAGGLYNPTKAEENDIIAAISNLTTEFCLQFTEDHPEPAGVDYAAYAGVTHDFLPWKDNSDEVDLLLIPTYGIMKAIGEDSEKKANDGMVTLWSAKWKPEYYREYQGAPLVADHFNEVGQILGLTDPDFDHLEYYRYLAGQAAATE